MQNVVMVICLCMGGALLYMNRDELARFIPPQVRESERVQYVERESAPQSMTWLEECRLYSIQSTADSRARRQYEWEATQGMRPTGIQDIDDAQVASTRLDMMDRGFWPKRWRDKSDEGHRWTEGRRDKSGPSEERVGASESKSPAWAGKPLGVGEDEREEPQRGSGVSTGKAMSRFLFGTQDERL
jgi:hypothetical protein